MDTCTFEIFGIGIKHLPGWRIVPDHGCNFNFDSGFVRFEENVADKLSQISLGLRWECSETDNETFLREFSEKIEGECHKKLKSKRDQFELLRSEIVENAQGRRMCMLETQYCATQALFKNPSKMKVLRVCNAAYYCEETHRMIICSLITTPAHLEENRAFFEEILRSVQSHAVLAPEAEAERMQARARVRQAARKKPSLPGGLSQAFKKKRTPEAADAAFDGDAAAGPSVCE